MNLMTRSQTPLDEEDAVRGRYLAAARAAQIAGKEGVQAVPVALT